MWTPSNAHACSPSHNASKASLTMELSRMEGSCTGAIRSGATAVVCSTVGDPPLRDIRIMLYLIGGGSMVRSIWQQICREHAFPLRSPALMDTRAPPLRETAAPYITPTHNHNTNTNKRRSSSRGKHQTVGASCSYSVLMRATAGPHRGPHLSNFMGSSRPFLGEVNRRVIMATALSPITPLRSSSTISRQISTTRLVTTTTRGVCDAMF